MLCPIFQILLLKDKQNVCMLERLSLFLWQKCSMIIDVFLEPNDESPANVDASVSMFCSLLPYIICKPNQMHKIDEPSHF